AFLSILGSASAIAQSDEIRGKNLRFVAGSQYTLNVTKDGRILLFSSIQTGCVKGKTGDEARLGREHKNLIKCEKDAMNSCGADGRSKCTSTQPFHGISTASYAAGILRLTISKYLGSDLMFTDNWTIHVSGGACSGENQFTMFGQAGVRQIASCVVRTGF